TEWIPKWLLSPTISLPTSFLLERTTHFRIILPTLKGFADSFVLLQSLQDFPNENLAGVRTCRNTFRHNSSNHLRGSVAFFTHTSHYGFKPTQRKLVADHLQLLLNFVQNSTSK